MKKDSNYPVSVKSLPLSREASAKAVRYYIKKRGGYKDGKIWVTFPKNDYLINGKVKLTEPEARRRVYWADRYTPYVRFDKRRFYLKARVIAVKAYSDSGKRSRAFISVDPL